MNKKTTKYKFCRRFLILLAVLFMSLILETEAQSTLPGLFKSESPVYSNFIVQILLNGSSPLQKANFVYENKKEMSKIKIRQSKINDDTSGNKDNRVTKIHTINHADELILTLYLSEGDQRIQMVVYNLLGKIVMEPQYISQSKGEYDHNFSIANLPNGVYLCVLTGKNFRIKEKFVISR